MFNASLIMKSPVVKVTADTSVDQAIDLMLEHNVSGLPVVDESGRLQGMFSETDQPMLRTSQERVARYMTKDVTSIDVADSIVEVARAFEARSVHRMPVTEEGTLVGVIGCRDLTEFVREMEKQVHTLRDHLPSPSLCDAWCNQD